MVNATVRELQRSNDVVWETLGETLEGMDAHLERADAPGQWTARQVLCHLLCEPGAEPVALLDGQRRDVLGYLATLGEADLARRARIPVFGPLLGTDEVPLPVFVGIMFDRHWAAHIEQLAKIRRAAGLPEAQYTTPTTGATR